MKLRIPISTALIAILLLLILSTLHAQDLTPQVPFSKESLVPLNAPNTKIDFDPYGLPGPINDGGPGLNSNDQTADQRAYEITTSKDDPNCDTGFGGYVNLEEINIFPWLGVEGDNVAWGPFFNSIGPIQYYGMVYNEMWITDDGIVLFDVHKNFKRPWMPQEIPDPALPNDLIAPLWQDMVIVEDRNTNRGVSAAQTPDGSVMVLEFDDLQRADAPKERYDLEIVMQRRVSHKPGVYEIVFAYDNIRGSLNGPLSIGLENWDGLSAAPYVSKGDATGMIENGLMICFNAISGAPPESPPEDVQASDGEHEDKIIVTWGEVAEAEGYEIFRAISADGEQTKLGSVDEPYFQDMTAEPGTTYAYWVTTCNTFGCSSYSDYDTGWLAESHRELTISNYFPFVMRK